MHINVSYTYTIHSHYVHIQQTVTDTLKFD
uniref:Uncharacterized protein n=1 Tax=Anguilla anguilla TaxID=7936 RepID=A0A0E9TPG0_ANGAN